MKVLIVSTPFIPVPPPTYGGLERVVFNLAAGLHQIGLDVTVACPSESHLPSGVGHLDLGPAKYRVQQDRTALIAGCDYYYYPRIAPNIESEDWFSGETSVVGDFIRSSRRIRSGIIRQSQDPFDFEMNYGAIPKGIVEHLNGWWEFMDDGLGFDNTEIAFRALSLGYSLCVDETNTAICLDHWRPLRGTRENVWRREFNLNDPRYYFLVEMTRRGKLPIIRDQGIDDTISLDYTMPSNIMNADVAVEWMRNNTNNLVRQWLNKRQPASSRVSMVSQ
jgi:glycosyltransferase involved in cell wall biosynthesis